MLRQGRQLTSYNGQSITYDAIGNPTNTSVDESFTYNEEGYISTHTITHGDDSDVYSYSYDDKGNITEIKKNGVVQQSYVYDENNQLIRENNLDLNKTIVYDYDGHGNIDTKTEYAFTLGDLGEVSDTVNYTYDTDWKDKLVSYNNQSITYDAIGNPTNYMGADMSWFARQMQSYSKNGTNITYTYDADGLRTAKTVNNIKHEYYYVDGQLRYERNGDSYEMYYNYDIDGRPVRAYKKDLVTGTNYSYYLITNTRGDVVETRDGNGNVSAKYTYDSWGKLISVTDASGNALPETSFAHQISLRYRGYVYDTETGLYYLQSRYYDPEVGRFLNADDVDFIGYSGEQLSYNAFAYCENNAVNNSDPSGCVGIDTVVGALFGVAFAVVGYFLSVLVENYTLLSKGISYIKSKFISEIKDNSQSFILDVIFGAITGALSTTNKCKVLNVVVTFINSIRESRKNGETITGMVINLIIDFIISSLIDSSQSFSKFNFKKVRNSSKSIISKLKSISRDKLKSIAKIISNQISYYLKQNSTLYSRYIKKYGLNSAVSWLSDEFKKRA